MERIKNKRASRRAMNTKIISEVDQLLQSQQLDLSALRVIHGRLRASNSALSALNAELEAHLTDEQAAEDYASVMEYDDAATSALALLEHHMEVLRSSSTLQTAPPLEDASGDRRAATSTGQPITPTREFGARLPKLELLRFDGAITRWQPFWDMFRHSVHENPRLSNIDRCHYLLSLLDGAAAEAVAGLQVTETCYQDALDILKNRFGNSKVIEQKHFENLRKLRPVDSASNVPALRKLYDHVQMNRRGLERLGVGISSYAAMLNEVLLKVIPGDIIVDYFKQQSLAASTASTSSQSSSAQDVEHLLSFLRVEVECRERSFQISKPQRSEEAYRGPKQQQSIPTAAVLHNRAQTSSCFFCSAKDHSTEECPSDIPLADKRTRLASDGRCFRCTAKGHLVRSCRKKVRCRTCKRRHASTMCTTDPARIPSESAAETRHAAMHGNTRKSATPRLSSDVLLQTFRAWMMTSSHCCYVRGVFDNGSQRTFIREDVVAKLKLKAIGEVDLAISAFGRSGGPKKKFKVVRATLRSQHDSTSAEVEAIVVPFICEDVAEATKGNTLLQRLVSEGKLLADTIAFPGMEFKQGVSLLIGSDQIWKFAPKTSHVQWEETNPALVAVSTSLGWTLQGPLSLQESNRCKGSTLVCVLRTDTRDNEELPCSFRRFRKVDTVGLKNTSTSQPDEGALRRFEESTVGNSKNALSRLYRLPRQLSSNEEGIRPYDKAVKQGKSADYAEQVVKGHIEKRINLNCSSQENKRRLLEPGDDRCSHSIGNAHMRLHCGVGKALAEIRESNGEATGRQSVKFSDVVNCVHFSCCKLLRPQRCREMA